METNDRAWMPSFQAEKQSDYEDWCDEMDAMLEADPDLDHHAAEYDREAWLETNPS